MLNNNFDKSLKKTRSKYNNPVNTPVYKFNFRLVVFSVHSKEDYENYLTVYF